MHAEDNESKLDDVVQTILNRIANFLRHHSGKVLQHTLPLQLQVVHDVPLKSRAYRQLPEFLANKEAIINIKNQDTRGFGFAVLSALNPKSNKEHPNRPAHYIHLFKQYGLDAIRYPFAIEDIPAIDDKLGVTRNVFTFLHDKGEGRHPLYVKEKGHEKVIDLLFWDAHYTWLKNFRRFMADLSMKHTIHWCRRCLGHFDTADVLTIHQKYYEGLDSSG